MAISDIIVDYGILTAYIFLGIGIFLAILFPAIQMFKDFKKAIKTLIGVGVLALAFMVCFWMSAGEAMTVGENTISGGVMQVVEACLYLAYAMLAGAILAVVGTSFIRYIK